MLKDATVLAFLASTKPEAAKSFYEDALGLALIEDNPFFLIFGTGGIQLRVQKVDAMTPPKGTAFGWKVHDIAATMTDLVARGVKFERFEGMDQDAAGVWTPPGTASKVCWFNDPDGNLLSLTEGVSP